VSEKPVTIQYLSTKPDVGFGTHSVEVLIQLSRCAVRGRSHIHKSFETSDPINGTLVGGDFFHMVNKTLLS